MVKMQYVGPGTKPDPMMVEAHEVEALEKTGLWKEVTSKKKADPEKKEGE